MIKFVAGKSDGGVLIGLGVSEANVQKLKDGFPIVVKLNELFKNVPEGISLEKSDIAIFYGETEDAIHEELKSILGNALNDNVVQDRRKG